MMRQAGEAATFVLLDPGRGGGSLEAAFIRGE